jgi:hypothetical protein
MSTGETVAQRIHNLIRQKYAVHRSYPRALLERLTVETDEHLNFMADELAVRLSAYVLEEQVESAYLEYPADWWEACKARWLPAWMLRRWPVRWTRWRGDITAVYPDLLIPDQRVVMLTRFEKEGGA